MKQLTLLILMGMISSLVYSQKRDNFWLKHGISSTVMFTAGWLSATNEVVLHDYRRFKNRHPKWDENYFNPKISWKNKYKNYSINDDPKFWGSTSVLAWTTDAHHLRNTLRNMLICGNVAVSLTLYQKPKFKQILKQSLLSWGSFALGTGVAHWYYKKVD